MILRKTEISCFYEVNYICICLDYQETCEHVKPDRNTCQNTSSVWIDSAMTEYKLHPYNLTIIEADFIQTKLYKTRSEFSRKIHKTPSEFSR